MIEANIISIENAIRAIIFNVQKVESPFLSVVKTLTSSPNSAYKVMIVIITDVISCSNKISIYIFKIYLTIYLQQFFFDNFFHEH